MKMVNAFTGKIQCQIYSPLLKYRVWGILSTSYLAVISSICTLSNLNKGIELKKKKTGLIVIQLFFQTYFII